MKRLRDNGKFATTSEIPWIERKTKWIRDYKRKVYYERVKAGLCPLCRAKTEKFVLCIDCRKRGASRLRAYYRRKGGRTTRTDGRTKGSSN
jgi:hypothetical protein